MHDHDARPVDQAYKKFRGKQEERYDKHESDAVKNDVSGVVATNDEVFGRFFELPELGLGNRERGQGQQVKRAGVSPRKWQGFHRRG
jgi:hypothetical protein